MPPVAHGVALERGFDLGTRIKAAFGSPDKTVEHDHPEHRAETARREVPRGFKKCDWRRNTFRARKKPRADWTGETTCKPMEQEENQEKVPPRSWAVTQLGDPSL